LLAFLLVSANQTFATNFDIPNEGIEQTARRAMQLKRGRASHMLGQIPSIAMFAIRRSGPGDVARVIEIWRKRCRRNP
jgi:hypothetical protein